VLNGSIKQISNQNPVYGHTPSRDNWCHKWLGWKLHWILIVIPSFYKTATNNGTSAGQTRTMKTNQMRMEAKIQAKIKATTEKSEDLRSTLVSQMDIRQARTEAVQQEIIAKMDAHHERIEARMNAWRNDTTACLKSMQPASVEVSPRRSVTSPQGRGRSGKCQSTEETGSTSRVLPKATETDPG
jgi:hypothetical protein